MQIQESLYITSDQRPCLTAALAAQAVKRLQETLDWRRDTNVESITCSACLANPRAHYMHPVGFDRLGRPVLYSCLQLAANRSVEDNRRHMIATFEQVSECHIFGPALCRHNVPYPLSLA